MVGKCPNCHNDVRYVLREQVPIGIMQLSTPAATAYLCPECSTILGIETDSAATEARILATIANLKTKSA
jgi:uncharacterized protein with PIN domain